MHTIAYLGPAGTFSEEAAISYAADRGDVAYLPLASIPAVVTAIETDAATVGAVHYIGSRGGPRHAEGSATRRAAMRSS